jgi:YjbR protein
VTGPGDVAPEILDEIRPICHGLPQTYEEPAWIGIRWRVRGRTFAHVYTIDPARHLVYARAVDTEDPVCVLTFRSPIEDLQGLISGGFPFFRAGWGANVVCMVLGDRVDWVEVGELLTESYCQLAPKKLSALVAGGQSPPGAGSRRRPGPSGPPSPRRSG